MSNNCCPECEQYRKGEFCQVCYKRAKEDLLKQSALNQKGVEAMKASQREFLHTILNDVDMITSSTSYMDVPFKIKEYTKVLRARLPLLK
jgi:hypothetical protein